MATEKINLDILANGKPAIKAIDKVDKKTKKLGKTSKKTGKDIDNSLDRMKLGWAAVGASVILATRKLVQYTDAWTGLNNKIKLVTKSESEHKKVLKELFAISQRTRSELGATATLYSRIALATDGAGFSTEQLLRVVETLNKQVQIGGTNAQEAKAGLIQFAQGLASGRLQGDELRSVMEMLLGVQAGLISGFKKLQKAGKIDFEVTRKNIRELAASGVLSSSLLIDAVLASANETDKTYKIIVSTIEQAWIKVTNSIQKFVGESKEVNFAGKSLIKVFSVLGENIPLLASSLFTLTAVFGAISIKMAASALIAQTWGKAIAWASTSAAAKMKATIAASKEAWSKAMYPAKLTKKALKVITNSHIESEIAAHRLRAVTLKNSVGFKVLGARMGAAAFLTAPFTQKILLLGGALTALKTKLIALVAPLSAITGLLAATLWSKPLEDSIKLVDEWGAKVKSVQDSLSASLAKQADVARLMIGASLETKKALQGELDMLTKKITLLEKIDTGFNGAPSPSTGAPSPSTGGAGGISATPDEVEIDVNFKVEFDALELLKETLDVSKNVKQYTELSEGVEEYAKGLVDSASNLSKLDTMTNAHMKAQEKLAKSFLGTNLTVGQQVELLAKSNAGFDKASELMQKFSTEQVTEENNKYNQSLIDSVSTYSEQEIMIKAHTKHLKWLRSELNKNNITLEKHNELEDEANAHLEKARDLALAESEKGFASGFFAGNTAKDNMEEWETAGIDTADKIAGAFADMASGTKLSFKDMTRSILADLAKIALKQAIVKAISGIGSFFGFHSGTTEVKHTGGAIGRTNLPSFHNGMRSDERVAKLQVGEGVVNRMGARRNPGAIDAMNKGQSLGGNTTVVNVTYSPTVNALDPRTAQIVIAENAPTVVGIVRQAFNKTGQSINI